MNVEHEQPRATPRSGEPKGTIYFDGSCGLCSASAKRTERLFGSRGFTFLPLQAEGVAELLGLRPGEIPDEMKLRTSDERLLSGADALVHLSHYVWWMFPLRIIASLPPGMRMLRFFYRMLAQNRHRIGGTCPLHPEDGNTSFSPRISQITEKTDKTGAWSKTLDLLVVAIACVPVFVLGRNLPAWGYMWAVVSVIWLSLKWLMWRDAAVHGPEGNRVAPLWYLIGWPGMNARPFVRRTRPAVIPAREWIGATAQILVGAMLVWWATRKFMPAHPLLAGWIGLIGTALILHFGFFRLLADFWRARGVAVEPIMREPTRATSLADFWHRWNLAFRDFAYRFIFRPVHRRFGPVLAMLATFLFSGIIHDLVISVPARAGYGLPTLYFLIQGIGVIFEKSPFGKRFNPIVHRILMYAALVLPLALIFHPPFIHNVYLPFLKVIGALPTEGGSI